ncbi:MAG: protein translocase subunit SecF [Hydrogeniiclostridium sp.]
MKKFNIHFFKNRKIYFSISLALIAVGLICNIIMGANLDIQFRGGAIVKYSYTGAIDTDAVADVSEEVSGDSVDVRIYENVQNDGEAAVNHVSISFVGNQSISLENQKKIQESLSAKYPDAGFELVESSSVNPTMGQQFFAKCLIAVAITFLFLIIYVALRFKKIGGASAGIMAIIALLHDVSIIYFVFVIFRLPINDSFIAVVLTILGYSLNNTIVVYDRVRENRKLMGPKASVEELVDASINQTLTRSINTSLCTFVAIAAVYVVGIIYGLESVSLFALPMMIGVAVGCYSSVCLAGPLYVMWQNHKSKKRQAAAEK